MKQKNVKVSVRRNKWNDYDFKLVGGGWMQMQCHKWILNWKISHISIFSSMLCSPNHMILNFDYEPF